jgi:hypothetical protein
MQIISLIAWSSHQSQPNPLRSLLIGSTNNSGELINLDILRNHRALRLVLLVKWDLDIGTLDLPATDLADELLEDGSGHAEPGLEDRALHLADGLGNGLCDADANQLLEAGDVGDEVGVEIVAIEGAPEFAVGGAGEEIVEDVELLDCFGEGCIASCWERRGGGDRLEDMCWEEVQAEGEVWGGEDGEGLDEDIGDGLVAGEVWVELVSESTVRVLYLEDIKY